MFRIAKTLLIVGTLLTAATGPVSQAAPPFEITLNGPATFLPGQTLSGPFSGALTVAGVGVPSQTIEVFVDGQIAATAATTLQGSYAVSLPPFSGTASRIVTATAFGDTPVETSTQMVVEVVRYEMKVTPIGTGSGVVTSTPAGITCPGTCVTTYPATTVVELSAAPSSGSTFDGWSGEGCTGTGNCTVTLNANTEVTASFTLVLRTLTVVRYGNGTISGSGISCGSDCTEQYPSGTVVTLTASAGSGSSFAGWSGGGCTGTGSCVVTMTAAKTVTATFMLNQFVLTVVKAGSGAAYGQVISSPSGISCDPQCQASYAYGTVVNLYANGGTSAIFTGWSGGGCTGTGTCIVTVTAATTVTANFIPYPHNLFVSLAGSGSGTVTSNPSGINCPSDCTETYPNGTLVTLTADADFFSSFNGWSGGGCAGTGTCTVLMTATRSVTATFG